MARNYAYDLTTFLRVLVDLFCVTGAWVLAFYLRFYSGLPVPKGVPDWILYLKLIPFILGIWFFVFVATGFYRRSGHHKSALMEAWDILQSCFIATLVFISVTYFYNEYRYSRITLLFFGVIHPLSIVWGRSLARKGQRFYNRYSKPREVLVIGSERSFEYAIRAISRGRLVLGKVTGVIPAGDPSQVAETIEFCRERNYKIVDLPVSWVDFFAENPCESVVIALPYNAYQFLDKHLEEIANQVTDIKMIPDLLKITKFTASVDMVDSTPVINIHDSPLQGIGRLYKRTLDICGALVALFLFSPIMFVSAAVVRLSSAGPVFYRQERMGLDGKVFSILKFRTMPMSAEMSSGAVWATKNDQRATPIGSFLRKTSLDELPQLLNVLRGDMSLVGPRPERPVFVNKFRKNVPGYMLRHKVKAGMTGWAQINGWRGNTSIEKRIECDLFYIQNWSLWFDIKILILTVFKGFINPNAY